MRGGRGLPLIDLTGLDENTHDADDTTATPIEEAVTSTGTRPFHARSLGRVTVGGIRHSMLTLTSTALGGGLLAVSYVMSLVGMGLGTLLLVVGASMSYMSTVALMRMSTEVGHQTYAGLFAHCAGSYAAPILDTILFIYGNGTLVGYFVFIGDFVPALMKLAAPNAAPWVWSREFAITAAAIVLSPLATQRDVAKLRFLAPLPIVALVYVAIVIAVKCIPLYQAHQSDPSYGTIKLVDFNGRIFEALALCIFAYNCHLNVVPVAGALVRPSRARVMKVSYRVNLLQLSFYTVIGITGYISFLDKVPQDVLLGYDDKDVPMTIGRILLTMTMMISIPMNMVPTVRSFLQIIAYCCRRNDTTSALVPPMSPPASPRLGSPSPPLRTVPEAPNWPQTMERVLVAITCLAVTAGIAIKVPGVADVLGLLGATFVTAMMLVIPAYCIGKAMPKIPRNRAKQVALSFFAVLSATSVPIKLLRLAQVVKD